MIEAGVPFTWVRNTAKSPFMGELYAQHIEPHGRYILADTTGISEKLLPGWISGTVTFQNPLVIPWGTQGYAESDNWKQVLAKDYGVAGEDLSRALAKDGYDGIVTIKDGEISEIVDLADFVKDIEGRAERIGEIPKG